MSPTEIAASSTAIAQSIPNKCPSVAALQSTEFFDSDYHSGMWFFYGLDNQYDTNVLWHFTLGRMMGNSKEEAFQKAKTALAKLNESKYKPLPAPGAYACWYGTDENGTIGAAETLL